MSNARSDRIRETTATLVWRVPVRVTDASRSGCRLECSRWLPVGASGQLSVWLGGHQRQDDVRIARCQRREGAGQAYAVGVELLDTRALDSCSIRLAMGRFATQQSSADHESPNPEVGVASDSESDQPAKGASRSPPSTIGS